MRLSKDCKVVGDLKEVGGCSNGEEHTGASGEKVDLGFKVKDWLAFLLNCDLKYLLKGPHFLWKVTGKMSV